MTEEEIKLKRTALIVNKVMMETLNNYAREAGIKFIAIDFNGVEIDYVHKLQKLNSK